MDGLQQCFTGIKQEVEDERSILLPASAVLGESFFHHHLNINTVHAHAHHNNTTTVHHPLPHPPPHHNHHGPPQHQHSGSSTAGGLHSYDSSDNSSTKSRTSNESPEARARRLARNAARMRQKRASESYEEYKIRLAKNAEANRLKRQMESEMERAMRQVKDAARQRLRRAMESPEQRSSRLAKLAERMRMVRANESPDQRADRLKRSAARARERLSRESSEERRDRLHKRAEYARRMRATNSSGSDTASTSKSEDHAGGGGANRSSTSRHPNNSNHSVAGGGTNTPSLLGNGTGGAQLHELTAQAAHQTSATLNQSHDFPPHSQNLVTLNNVKTEFNQFALNQNPLFLDLRAGGYLNVPSYPNPPLNMFPESISSQVPPHLQNYVQSLSIHSLHPSQLGVLPNPNCFPVPTNHPQIEHPSLPPSSTSSSVIQTPSAAAALTSQNSFLGQHHSPFPPPLPPPNSENVSGNHHTRSPAINNHHQAHQQQRSLSRDSSSNDSRSGGGANNINDRKVFPQGGHGTHPPPDPDNTLRNDVDRQKAMMNELLEEQINIILSSPKRNRGRPNRGRESSDQRARRLRKMAESRRIKRANETPAERQHRLQMLTDRARHRRDIIKATETEEERRERLSRQAEYARRRRMKEQLPDAKSKADQRAKELYAKLHQQEKYIKNEYLSIMRPLYDSVKLKIPNPGQLQQRYAAANNNKLNENNVQSNLFEPIIQMQTI